MLKTYKIQVALPDQHPSTDPGWVTVESNLRDPSAGTMLLAEMENDYGEPFPPGTTLTIERIS